MRSENERVINEMSDVSIVGGEERGERKVREMRREKVYTSCAPFLSLLVVSLQRNNDITPRVNLSSSSFAIYSPLFLLLPLPLHPLLLILVSRVLVFEGIG